MSLEEEIEALKKITEKQKKVIDGYTKANEQRAKTADWEGLITKGLSDQHNVLTYVSKQHTNILKATGSYLTNTKEQFLYAQGLAKEYKMVARDLGLGVNLSKQMSKNFKDGMVYMEKMGYDADDLKEIMTSLVEESGRIKLLTGDEIKILSELRRGIGLSNGEVGAMSERFDLMGINIKTMGKSLNDVFSDAQKMGLNATKVVKVLENNFAGMQRMSFAGGTKAMTEMAKLAVSMRADVGEMLGMAKQFYNPEQAIEAVAELQLMGGDIAEAFGDPFEIMYLARNKPEELAKKVQSMTENMVQFNEKTGEYELPPEALQQLDFMSDKLNLNKDRVIDMAFQTSKLKDIKEAMGGGDIFDDNQMDAIASMAKMGDNGSFVVEVEDEDGNKRQIDVGDTSSLKEAITAGLLDSTPDAATEKEAIAQTAKNSFTSTEILDNMLRSMQAQAAVQLDFYQKLEQGTVKTRETMDKVLQETVSKVVGAISNNTKIKTVLDPEALEKFDTGLSTTIESFSSSIITAIEAGDPKVLLNLIDIKMGTLLNGIGLGDKGSNKNKDKAFKEKIETPKGPNEDFISRPGQPVQSFVGPDTVMGAKKGGPIDKMLDSTLGSSNSNVSGEVKIPDFNINVNLNGANGLSANDLGKTLMPVLKAKILEKIGDQIFVKGGKEKDGFPTNATS
jgi:hypothetical protein